MKTVKKLLEGSQARELSTTRIKCWPPFRDLFPVHNEKVKAIAEHMKLNGYDKSQPVILWDASAEKKGPHDLVMIDGHTRLQAAGLSRIGTIWAVVVKFPNEQDALEYAIHNQRDRRNVTDSVLLRCIQAVDKLKQQGGDRKSEGSKASSDAIEKGKSSEQTARVVGTSPRKVEKARTVLSKADEKTKQAVLDGTKSINAAYTELRGATPVVGAEPETATFVKAHCVCPYCGKKIYEDQIKLMREPVAEKQKPEEVAP